MKNSNYAWLICLNCTLLMVCTSGFCNNVFPVFLPYIEAADLTGAQGSLLISIRCFAGVISMLFVERYYKLFSLRMGLVVTCLCTGGAFMLYSFSHAVWMYDLAATLAGIGYGLGSIIPVGILVRSWFNERQGMAMGICAAGSGVAMIVFPPIVTRVIESVGTAAAFRAMSVFVLLVGLLVFVMVRDTPAAMGLQPYGKAPASSSAAGSGAAAAQKSEAAKVGLGGMICTCILIGVVGTGALGHFSTYFHSIGYPMVLVSAAVSVYGISLTLGKFICGWAFDRIGNRNASMLFFFIAFTGCILCSSANGSSPIFLFAGLILMGVGLPPCTVGMPLWAGDFSGGRDFRRVLKTFQISYTLGGTVFSVVPGVLYDTFGSYRISYLIFCAALLAVVLSFRLQYMLLNRSKS